MLLKKLTLSNFRPFKGEHIIEFSTNKEKNVTLVMAENGAGKTTLAQAFQWALYSKTDGFKNKSVLNSIVEKEMMGGTEQSVMAKLELEHKGIDYTIIRKQNYRKDTNGYIKQDNPTLEIYQKQEDGNTTVINPIKNLPTIANILPETLSKYFFFDGERIEKMAGEVTSGKSNEFKSAVQNILGLTALIKALEHLNPDSKYSVIGKYYTQLDEAGDNQTKCQYEIIYKNTEIIQKNCDKIEKMKDEVEYYVKEIEKAKAEILSYADAEKLQTKLNELNKDLQKEHQHKNDTISTLLINFTRHEYIFMSRKLISDALVELKNTNNVDKGIPDIRDETIKYLINRKKCLCGCDLSDPTSTSVQELTQLLKYIPPQSLGGAIKQFQDRSSTLIKTSDTYFFNIESQLSTVRGCSNKIDELEHEIGEIDKSILKLSNKKIQDLKNRENNMNTTLSNLDLSLKELEKENILLIDAKNKAQKEITKLESRIEKNRTIDTQILYAKAVYDKFKQTYDSEETKTREKLENQINELFKKIYAGGMTINIDDKYRITSYVNELQDNSKNIDANTAKSYSIIFAFIVGVINLAKQKVKDKTDESSIITDEYPLVMDAPLSSFDQRRIKNICEVIPGIARQVIIFIKDADGNIAKKEMQNKIGIEYVVSLKDKNYPVESIITKVGD